MGTAVADDCAILIVDDNVDDREFYRRMLARVPEASYSVREAENGVEGLALSEQKRPDCILLDYSLPGRDGIGVLEEILKQDPTANVVMLTGQGSETVAVDVMKAGARDYLTKDALSPQALHWCIQNAIMHGDLEAKLEQKRQSLEIFTRAMAHDLKEPLRTIKSFSKILQVSTTLSDEDRELLDYVLGAADHMEDLIVKLSGFTKLEVSGELEMKPVALSTAIERVESNLREQIANSRASISYGDLPEVMGDATLLVQLLQNLVSNAIRYCADRPEVRVSAESDGAICRLALQDNGPGVDPEHREVIFQPFKRLVGRGVEGTGLGLAICRRIAQLHGGAIWCEGKEPVGSTFIVELPLARPAATASTTVPDGQGAKAVPPPEGSSRLAEVLLVEDSPADVQLLKIKLMQRAKVSFNLHVAANGRDAIRLLQERATADGEPGIDLMLLDINMPIMDGFEVLDALSADTQLKSIPVCILSTSSDEDDMQRAKSLGASAYMIKPPTLQQFREVLDGLDHLDLQPRGDGLVLYAEHSRQTPIMMA